LRWSLCCRSPPPSPRFKTCERLCLFLIFSLSLLFLKAPPSLQSGLAEVHGLPGQAALVRFFVFFSSLFFSLFFSPFAFLFALGDALEGKTLLFFFLSCPLSFGANVVTETRKRLRPSPLFFLNPRSFWLQKDVFSSFSSFTPPPFMASRGYKLSRLSTSFLFFLPPPLSSNATHQEQVLSSLSFFFLPPPLYSLRKGLERVGRACFLLLLFFLFLWFFREITRRRKSSFLPPSDPLGGHLLVKGRKKREPLPLFFSFPFFLRLC